MMDQTGVCRASVCAAVVSLTMAACVIADETPAAATNAQAPAEGEALPAKPFEPLCRLTNIQGLCEVNNPDVGHFEPVQNNKAYPLGSVVRTGAGASLTVVFSAQESVAVAEKTELALGAAKADDTTRFVRLISGHVKTTLRDNLPEGAFSLETDNTTCKNMSGRGDFSLTTDNNAETFQVATITGSSTVQGRQYIISALRAANTVNIQTSPDHSLTRLTSVSGDFAILLENGSDTPVNYGMSPKAVVKIWRENAPVGGRAVISTLVVSPTGKARHRFAYVEGQANLTTGELITAPETEDKEKDAVPGLLTQPAAGTTPAAASPEAAPSAPSPF